MYDFSVCIVIYKNFDAETLAELENFGSSNKRR